MLSHTLQRPGFFFKASCNVCWLMLGISYHCFALTLGCWQGCSSCPYTGASSRVFPITWAGHHIPFSISVLMCGAARGGLLHKAHSCVAEPASPTSPT